MALTPQEIRGAQFTPVKRAGYDAGEVEAFQRVVADALQDALNDAAAMESRARAAVARLKQWTARYGDGTPAAMPLPVAAPTSSGDDTDAVARALVLAQRAGDEALHEARAEAAQLVETARDNARREGEAVKSVVDAEVSALVARRAALETDVAEIERHIRAQRERITEVVAELEALTNRAVNGLADLRQPQLSGADRGDVPAAPVVVATPDDSLTASDDSFADDIADDSGVFDESDAEFVDDLYRHPDELTPVGGVPLTTADEPVDEPVDEPAVPADDERNDGDDDGDGDEPLDMSKPLFD